MRCASVGKLRMYGAWSLKDLHSMRAGFDTGCHPDPWLVLPQRARVCSAGTLRVLPRRRIEFRCPFGRIAPYRFRQGPACNGRPRGIAHLNQKTAPRDGLSAQSAS